MAKVFLAAIRACLTHRAASKAAALAFYTLFSTAPILVLVMAAAGFLLGPQAAQGAVFAQLRTLVGPNGARAIENLAAGAQVPGTGAAATTIAVVLLAVGATSLFAELKDSLDEIWNRQVPVPTGILALLRSRLLSFGLVLTLSFLLLTSLVVSTTLALLAGFWEGLWAGSFWVFSSLSALFTFLVIACLFAVIYKMLPEVSLPWRDVAVGALCTASLFSLGEYAIAAYLRSGGITTSFGAAGSLAVLLIWVYYSAQIFFLGAEFTREYALTLGSLRGRRRP
ncbi:MAG: YihY/virulence factor BrkB family protein [Holophaga sp.]|nr:YihY/virulence factor BrkB family protein [Holophaga sp.]